MASLLTSFRRLKASSAVDLAELANVSALVALAVISATTLSCSDCCLAMLAATFSNSFLILSCSPVPSHVLNTSCHISPVQRYMIVCPSCSGSGLYQESLINTCPGCDSVGSVLVYQLWLKPLADGINSGSFLTNSVNSPVLNSSRALLTVFCTFASLLSLTRSPSLMSLDSLFKRLNVISKIRVS